jgi:hypothetical protein
LMGLRAAACGFGPNVHSAVGDRAVRNEFLSASFCLSFHTFAIVTGLGDQANCLTVVVGVGKVHTTTSRRVPR